MESTDLRVLRTLRDWRAEGHRALLATVIRTWGSAPRPVGALMALREDGLVVGSVSGGCIEDDLIFRYTRARGARSIPDGAPQLIRYGLNADEAHRFGLPCGGTLELLLEFDPQHALLEELVCKLKKGELVRRTVCCEDGHVTLDQVDKPQALQFDGKQLISIFGPEYRMLLIGAGILAEYLSTMALFNEFSVTLCDPRLEYMDAWTLPDVQKTTEMPDDAVVAFQPDRRSCIITLSHDPKLDDLALLEAIHSPAFYVGAIGSRRNNARRRDRMMKYFDETEASLARLRGPAGIYINSKTPAEIAVSIMAEVLAVKNGIRLAHE